VVVLNSNVMLIGENDNWTLGYLQTGSHLGQLWGPYILVSVHK